ncbi:hypothetical protein DENSPDRAFT_914892 [Dentipellis sp. KUC8613]|nr:hypothetical protein DENSPDRAFT_914892 [Dentipellis sp. KUC8613]
MFRPGSHYPEKPRYFRLELYSDFRSRNQSRVVMDHVHDSFARIEFSCSRHPIAVAPRHMFELSVVQRCDIGIRSGIYVHPGIASVLWFSIVRKGTSALPRMGLRGRRSDVNHARRASRLHRLALAFHPRARHMQHSSDLFTGQEAPLVPEASQRRRSRAHSKVSDNLGDPYAFSRIGNRLFGAGSARHSSASRISYQESPAPLTHSGQRSIRPSHPPAAAALSVKPLPAVQSSTTAPSSLDLTPAPAGLPFATPTLISSFGRPHAPSSSPFPTADLSFPSIPSSAPLDVAARSMSRAAVGNGAYPSSQVNTPRTGNQVPTEADADTLFAFFNGDRGRLPPHVSSSYSSLAGALSEPASVESRHIGSLSRAQLAPDVERPNNTGLQFGSRMGIAVADTAPTREVSAPSIPTAPVPYRGFFDSLLEAGPPWTPSAFVPRKRRATSPPSSEAERVETQAVCGDHLATEMVTTADPEPEPEHAVGSEYEGADEDVEDPVVESKEALRSRRRRGKTKDLIRALYAEVEESVRVKPFETLTPDEAVQFTTNFIKSRRDVERQKDVRIQRLEAFSTTAQSKIRIKNGMLEDSAAELKATKQQKESLLEQLRMEQKEKEGLRSALNTAQEELRQYGEQGWRNGQESQSSSEKGRRCPTRKVSSAAIRI